jgi:hypothetical protein
MKRHRRLGGGALSLGVAEKTEAMFTGAFALGQ